MIWRGSVTVGAILLFASLPALFAQTVRQEGSIRLPAGVSVAAPPGRVNFSAVVSRNAGLLATNFNDNIVRVWALPSGELVHDLDTKADPATKLRLSDDGRLLAIAAKSGIIKVWDIAPWGVRQELAVSSPARVLAISPDNRLLAIATDHDEQIWELPTQKRLAVLHTPFDCYCLMIWRFRPTAPCSPQPMAILLYASMMRTPELCVVPHRICSLSHSLSTSLRTANRSSSAGPIK
jgi:WD40 repeat protein